CGGEPTVYDFDQEGYVAHRHVYDHVLRESEAWGAHVACDLEAVRQRLSDLKCRGAGRNDDPESGHGNRCPNFTACHKELEQLLPHYREVVKATLQDGATRPRHSHAKARRMSRAGKLYWESWNYFLSNAGFIAATYERTPKELHLKTAYRRDNGLPLGAD